MKKNIYAQLLKDFVSRYIKGKAPAEASLLEEDDATGLFCSMNKVVYESRKQNKVLQNNIYEEFELLKKKNDYLTLRNISASKDTWILFKLINFLSEQESNECADIMIDIATNYNDEAVRKEAISRMNLLKNSKYEDVLLLLSNDKNEDISWIACRNLAYAQYSKNIEDMFIKKILNAKSNEEISLLFAWEYIEKYYSKFMEICEWSIENEQSEYAFENLEKRTDVATNNFLTEKLHGENRSAKYGAIEILAKRKDPQIIPIILDLCAQDDYDARRSGVEAIHLLATWGGKNLFEDNEPSVLREVEAALLKSISPIESDDDSGTKWCCKALEALSAINCQRAQDVSIPLLADKVAQPIRLEALKVLCSDAAKHADIMRAIFNDSRVVEEKKLIMDKLSNVKDQRIHELIIPLLGIDEYRIIAAASLLSLGDDRGWNILVAALNDRDSDYTCFERAIVADHFMRSDDRRRVFDLYITTMEAIDLDSDSDRSLLSAIIENFGKLGDTRAIAPILRWRGCDFCPYPGAECDWPLRETLERLGYKEEATA